MCFVRGVILGDFASSSAPRLSSNALQNTVGAVLTVSLFLDINSSNKLIIGITSLNACDTLIYSASVVLRLHSKSIIEPNNVNQVERTRLNEIKGKPENTPDIKLDLVDYINECSKEQQQILSTDNRKNQKLVIVPIKK